MMQKNKDNIFIIKVKTFIIKYIMLNINFLFININNHATVK